MNTQGANRDLGAGQGQQGEVNGSGTRRQNQACGAGRREERRRTESGGCGRSLWGRSTTAGEEMGSGCTESEATTTDATDGGGGRREEGNGMIHKSG